MFFVFKQKTAYEMRISDWSSDVCSSDLKTSIGASNPFQTISREDVGLTLRIRPQISEGGTVKLALYQEVSSIDASVSTAANGLVTRKRALETNVLVDDSQIIVLGGLIEDVVNDTTKAVDRKITRLNSSH